MQKIKALPTFAISAVPPPEEFDRQWKPLALLSSAYILSLFPRESTFPSDESCGVLSSFYHTIVLFPPPFIFAVFLFHSFTPYPNPQLSPNNTPDESVTSSRKRPLSPHENRRGKRCSAQERLHSFCNQEMGVSSEVPCFVNISILNRTLVTRLATDPNVIALTSPHTGPHVNYGSIIRKIEEITFDLEILRYSTFPPSFLSLTFLRNRSAVPICTG